MSHETVSNKDHVHAIAYSDPLGFVDGSTSSIYPPLGLLPDLSNTAEAESSAVTSREVEDDPWPRSVSSQRNMSIQSNQL